jgi:hypothetical protein
VAFDAHLALVSLDDAAHDREPEACAVARWFRGEERFEHPIDVRKVDARPVVSHRNLDSTLVTPCDDLDATLCRRHMTGVREQIHEDLG